MADDQRELAALGAVDHRDAQVAGLPGFDRHPRMQLAVVERERAVVVDDDAGVVGIAVGVELHDRKAAPDLVQCARSLEGRHLGAVHPAHQRGVDAHRQAVQRVLRKHHQIEPAVVAPRLAHHRDDALGLLLQLRRRLDHRQLKLHQSDDDALRRFVQSPESTHLLFPCASQRVETSSPGLPCATLPGRQLMTRITSVST